ncbi:GNAT family N-acetyltransferase [Niveibacterium sp. 24ML]|uniref:GNAT family N-acetyltransferase n=1 Tax=Niveibacterium sp. 24ML TaxID=2985512 RepID=UPI00226E703C|nr:GNAT family N-acetyltransferase [Niveibacterium sp. 24ML]MCX9157186.1 GNAT family N-acetyltransferase [Niveibacterium sp. 24ML]
MTESLGRLCAAVPSDTPALAEVYRAAVQAAGRAAYSAPHVAAWAAYADAPAFAAEVLAGECVLIEVQGRIAAFAQLSPNDHVRLLYTHPDFMRRGFAARLLAHLEQTASEAGQTRLDTDASPVSRPLFERAGWSLLAVQTSLHQGLSFERFRMVKDLIDPGVTR